MTMSAPSSRPRADAAPAQIEQVYVTHCLQADSVRNHAGFSVRATSTADAALQKFAFDYPAYELPMDMWSANPRAYQAPARLARVHGPDEGTALVHSAYVEKDTVGRTGSYFTHVLLCPRVTLAEALQSWGSREWATDYRAGLPQRLAPLARLPAAGAVSEQAVTAFLSGGGAAAANLATVTCPARLSTEPARRQELLRLALHGCLLALRDGPQGARGRFYLLAEPGLTALLLYGVARLLPGRQVEALTFSAYENLHRLRQYKLAQVVGTYVSSPDKGLDAEFVLTRGYALDTFQTARSSPEVQAAQSAEVDELVALAARGEWAEVRKRYHYQATDTVTLEGLAALRKFHDLAQRIRSGQLRPDDLLALRASAAGRQFLEQSADLVWPHVRESALTSEPVRQEFADLLRERLADVKAQGARQLAAGALPRWLQHWGLIQFLRGGDRNRLRADFVEMLPQAGVGAADVRLSLLRDWQRLQPPGDAVPPPVDRLLTAGTPEELERFRDSSLPLAWLGVVLKQSLHAEATVAAAVQMLQGAGAELQAVFCREILPQYPPERQAKLLGMVLDGTEAEGQRRLGRLLESGLQAPPETVQKLLKALHAHTPGWVEFWRQGDHLPRLLASVRAHGEAAARLWESFAGALDKNLLLGSKEQRQLFARLQDARAAVGDAVPRAAAALLDDWALLLTTLEDAAAAAAPPDLDAACQRRCGAAFDAVLKARFVRVVQEQPAEDAHSLRFMDVFKARYPKWRGGQFQDAASLLRQWLALVKDCKDTTRRAELQLLFARRHLPAEHHRAVAKELKEKLAFQAYEALRRSQPEAEGPAAAQAEGKSAPAPRTLWETARHLPSHLSGRARVGLVLAFSHLLIFVVAFLLGRSGGAPAGKEELDTSQGERIVDRGAPQVAKKQLAAPPKQPGNKAAQTTAPDNRPKAAPKEVALIKQALDKLLAGTRKNQPALLPENMGMLHDVFLRSYYFVPDLSPLFILLPEAERAGTLTQELEQLSKKAGSLGKRLEEEADATARAGVVNEYVQTCLEMQAAYGQLAEVLGALKKAR